MEQCLCLNSCCGYFNPLNQKSCSKCKSNLLLNDRYRAVKLIGAGAFGRVFKAIDENRLKTPCVIKQFSIEQQENNNAEFFEKEAMRLCDLGKHPQIPDLLAFLPQDQHLYLVQEFIEGQDLKEELQEQGKFSQEKIIDLLNQLLPVLIFIHQNNVIHRDIKPDNIVRHNSGSLILIDFGVSKLLSDTLKVEAGTLAGTPGYMAVEQLQGYAYPASDIYSLGVTCIRLLTGCFPAIKNHTFVNNLFDPINQKWIWRSQANISDELGLILDKMLSISMGDRYQSAAEVLQALQRSEVGQSILKHPKPVSPLRGIYYPPTAAQKTINLASNLETNLSQKSNFQLLPDPLEPTINEKQNNLFNWLFNSSDPFNKSVDQIILESERNIDYAPLRDLLAAGKWKEADVETYRLVLKAANREKEKYLDGDNWLKFPCKDLLTIDQLWVKYSDGHFGFSVQKQIWESKDVGGDSKARLEIEIKFVEKLGWRKGGTWKSYDDLTFNTDAPMGHLPVLGCGWVWWWFFVLGVSSLAQRLVTCKI